MLLIPILIAVKTGMQTAKPVNYIIPTSNHGWVNAMPSTLPTNCCQLIVIGLPIHITDKHHSVIMIDITVNFQNHAQVQINAWFILTPGTKHTVYNL